MDYVLTASRSAQQQLAAPPEERQSVNSSLQTRRFFRKCPLAQQNI